MNRPHPAWTSWAALTLVFMAFGYAAGAAPSRPVTILWAFLATADVDILWLAWLNRGARAGTCPVSQAKDLGSGGLDQ